MAEDGARGRAALTAVLGEAGVCKLEEAGVLDYCAGALEGDEPADELAEMLAPMLLEAGAAVSEPEADALCKSVLGVVRESGGGEAGGGGGGGAAPVESRLLSAPVTMGATALTEDKEIRSLVRSGLRVQINVNRELARGSNEPINTDETEDEMRHRFKMQRRGEKMLKRAARRERVLSMQRDEFMRELTREPVVLHWRSGGGSNDILLKGAQVDINGLSLLEDCDLTLVGGRKYGLIGRNGVGKTTFLKFLAAHRFEGVPEHLQILHIEQEVPGGERSVLEAVLETDRERTALLVEQEELLAEEEDTAGGGKGAAGGADGRTAAEREEDLQDEADRQARLAEVMDRLVEIDADSAPARAATILAGLGFGPSEQQRPTASFSGGWRMRVSLARALFVEPDVLLLDEPTNHLDLHAVLWLQEYLQRWDKTLVVVSHARSFLNSVVTDILHFQAKGITRYKGDYDHFEGTRADQLRNNERKAEAQDKARAHMNAFITKFRANANRAKMVQSRIKALGRMETVAEILSDPTLCFKFPSPEQLSAPVLQMTDVAFGYEGYKGGSGAAGEAVVAGGAAAVGRDGGEGGGGGGGGGGAGAAESAAAPSPAPPSHPLLFENVCLGLDMESRVALVGPNGVGKSTLLKILLGELQPGPDSRGRVGSVTRASRLRVGYFSQHHVDQLDLKLTALESFQKAYPLAKPLEIRAHLGGMGLGGTLALQRMSTLSGGQKSRVAFAQIMWQAPHLLLLDEPTNHLDLDAVEALIHALIDFDGGVLVISHDEHLVTSVAETLWVAEPGKVKLFRETFDVYKKRELARGANLGAAGAARPSKPKPAADKKKA